MIQRLIDAIALEKSIRDYADKKHYNGDIVISNGILKSLSMVNVAPTISKWINIKDESPTENSEVLVSCICDMRLSNFYGTYKCIYEDGEFWVDTFDHDPDIAVDKDAITHWCYTPENPKRD